MVSLRPLTSRDRRALRTALFEATIRTDEQIVALTHSFDNIVRGGRDDQHDPEGTTIAFERAQVRSLLDQAKTDRAALQDATARLATTPTAYARTARNASASSACWSSPGPHAASPVPTPE